MALNQRKLNVASMKKDDKQFDEKISITTQGYSLTIDAKFRTSKIAKMVIELIHKYDYAREKEIDLDGTMSNYVVLLILKHFSSVDVPEEFEQQLIVLDMMVDGGYLEEIYRHIPEDQITKVIDSFRKATKNIYEGLKLEDEIVAANEPNLE